MIMVPYKGGRPAMIDVMSGQIPVMFSSLTQVLPHLRSGKLKVLAIGADKRSPVVPDIPTVAEAGFPGYEVYVWWGIAAPAGTPGTVQEKLRQEFAAILGEPGTRKMLATEAAVPRTMTPAELRKMISSDRMKWADVAKQAGIRLN